VRLAGITTSYAQCCCCLQERTLFITDWWHTTGGALSMRLNRPFDANRTTNTSGAWAWVNNPQASTSLRTPNHNIPVFGN